MKRVLTILLLIVFVCHRAWCADIRSNVITSNSANATVSFSLTNQYEWEWDGSSEKLRSSNYYVNSSTSKTTIKITNTSPCMLSFDYAVSSENSYDKLTISMDGVTIANGISGITNNSYSKEITSGTHSLVLEYKKDNSTSKNYDRGYISNLKLEELSGVHWSFESSSGKLTIFGNGEMEDYSRKNAPWSLYKTVVKTISIEEGITNIGDYAFSDFSALSSIAISNSVISIGNVAFDRCSGLKSVNIPNSVTNIGVAAFYNCSGLTSITIPNSVTDIKDNTFYGCSGLTSVTIPNSITSIGASAFQECSWLTSVTIPNSVTNIGTCAFSYCSRLTSISIPNSVTSIGKSVFEGCSGLKSISLPNSVSSIESGTFYGCSGLISVTIPNSVTNIGNYAFEGCSKLTSVTIPNSVVSIGDLAFYGCSELTYVYITDIASWCKIVFSGILSNPLYYAQNLYIDGNLITDLVIPNSVTRIEPYAFVNCSALKSVCIPNSVISIEEHAFRGCSGIKSVTIPNSVTSIEGAAFAHCSGLTSITIPNSVTVIGNNAFYGCQNLYDIICESEVPPILEGDDNLGYVPSNLTVYVPFNSISSYKNAKGWQLFNIKAIGVKITLNGFSYIIYENNTAEVTSGTPKEEVVIPDYIEVNGQSYTVNAIVDNAFYGCKEIVSLYIPNTVTTIGKEAFYGCVNLNTITCNRITPPAANSSFYNYKEAKIYVPYNSIQQYENAENWRQFEDFIGIGKEVEIDGIAYIAYSEDGSAWVLKGTSKDEITLPDHIMVDGVSYIVNAIHRRAFYDIEGIAKIILPSTITSIGNRALYNMTKVYCNAVAPPAIDYRTFGTETSVYVPIGTKSVYRQAPYWADHERLFVMEDHHDFGDVIWEWDESENAVAKLICKNDEEEIFTEEAVITSTVITPSTCTVKGKKKLTAKATFTDLEGCPEYTTVKDIELPLAEHTMTIVNNNDGTHSDVCSACGGNEHRESHSFTDGYCKACGAVSGEPDTNVAGLSNVLYANNVAAEPGKEVTIPVKIKSSVSMTGFQFNISAPFVDLSNAAVAYSSAMPNQNVSFRSALQSDGTIRVLCYSTDGENLGGTGNNVCTISFLLPEDLQKQGYPVTISNIRLTQSGTLYKTETGIKSTVTMTDDASGNQQPGGDNPGTDSTEDNPADLTTALYALDATGCANGTFVLPIELKSDFSVKSFQFDIEIPEGMSFVPADGAYSCHPTDRINSGFSVICNNKVGENANIAQILCSNNSSTSATINGTSGVVLNIPIKIAGEVTNGEYDIFVKNITLVKADGTEYKELRRKVFKATATVTSYVIGDANNSGEVNVADITAVVSHIYGQTPAIFNHSAADVNASGEINVADITGIVTIIYGGTVTRAKGAASSTVEELTLSVPSVTVNAGNEVTLPIYIDNAGAVSAFQFDLSLPDGVMANDVRCTSDRHLSIGRYMDDGKYRIMTYSLSNETFINSSAPVAYISLDIDSSIPLGTYDINLSSAYTSSDGKDFVTHTGNAKLIIGNVTGINTIANGYNTHDATTISGVKVKADNHLQKGIYIINGKKQVR